LSALWVSTAGAAPANYAGASADGSTVFFTTEQKLVPGDTDSRRDVYERFFDSEAGIESYITREVSTGPTGGNDAYDVAYNGASEDGTKVFFSTDESLVAEDTDRSADVYVRDLTTGVTSLVSQGSASCLASGCGNGTSSATFAGATPDGSKVVFSTDERLSSEDEDNSLDLYLRDLSGATALVSQGDSSCTAPNCGNNAFPVSFDAISSDGSKVIFSTAEALGGGDEDTLQDVYRRDLGTGATALVSAPGTCPGELDCSAIYGGASADGSHVFFETKEQVSPQDEDESQDAYDWSGGTATLVSTGPEGGNGTANATFVGTDASGGATFFQTGESLVAEDADTSSDVYERSGGATTLTSIGPSGGNGPLPASFDAVSPDGSKVIFSTAEPLVGGDTDTSSDVYERSGGTTALISTGPSGGNGAFDAGFAGSSADGSSVIFSTAEPLVGGDTDTSSDVYERSGGTTALISTGPSGGNGEFTPHLTGLSSDGAHSFFTTEERLTADDLDTETDVYDRSGGSGTLLVSVGNSVQLGPAIPTLTGTNPPSPNPSTEPTILGQADPGTSMKVYPTPDCSGAPAAVGTSTQLGGAGIRVTVAAGSTTTFHATATDTSGDTSACSTDAVTYRQVAESGGGGGTGGGGGGPGSGFGGSQPGSGEGGGGSIGGAHAVAPQTRITFAPAFKTRLRRPIFQFADTTGQEGTTFFCKVDRHSWQSCRSPQKLAKLRAGRHVFHVKGFNSGIWEAQSVSRSFKVVSW
jgi:hypothetical protein